MEWLWLVGMVKGRVRGGEIYYAYESHHKDRSTKMCVRVCQCSLRREKRENAHKGEYKQKEESKSLEEVKHK